ncbi:MAG: DNA-directed RNA polymerase subunit omega [Firmicutes bacterium]|jgi:DNA-directed RNA polymerase subunit omega|nr:DNA-directed RNA polymerase subunit omega [Bacillota bacterium]NLL89327.1 DNA-directed RNA polymerase subunit omega [Bacillota bacterium]HKM17096.1 DNA-directed RNA polymerase subunit omega [Limnochordia bacterium]
MELDKKPGHVDNRYTLVVAAAKRARQILAGASPTIESEHQKPVTIALAEVAAGKIQWVRTKEGIK